MVWAKDYDTGSGDGATTIIVFIVSYSQRRQRVRTSWGIELQYEVNVFHLCFYN